MSVIPEPPLELRPPGWLRNVRFRAPAAVIAWGAEDQVGRSAEEGREPKQGEHERVCVRGAPHEGGRQGCPVHPKAEDGEREAERGRAQRPMPPAHRPERNDPGDQQRPKDRVNPARNLNRRASFGQIERRCQVQAVETGGIEPPCPVSMRRLLQA
jgi:hypothetical protein